MDTADAAEATEAAKVIVSGESGEEECFEPVPSVLDGQGHNAGQGQNLLVSPVTPQVKKLEPLYKKTGKKRVRNEFIVSEDQKKFLRTKFMRLGYCRNVCSYCLQIVHNDHVSR